MSKLYTHFLCEHRLIDFKMPSFKALCGHELCCKYFLRNLFCLLIPFRLRLNVTKVKPFISIIIVILYPLTVDLVQYCCSLRDCQFRLTADRWTASSHWIHNWWTDGTFHSSNASQLETLSAGLRRRLYILYSLLLVRMDNNVA